MPKRDFIPNIDDANAEITRLDTELASLATVQLNLTNITGEKVKVDGLLATANTTIEAHVATIALRDKSVSDAAAQKVKDDAEIAKLQGELATAKGTTHKQIAKAGAAPVPVEPKEGIDDDKDELKGLKGIQRAIKARELQIKAGAKLAY